MFAVQSTDGKYYLTNSGGRPELAGLSSLIGLARRFDHEEEAAAIIQARYVAYKEEGQRCTPLRVVELFEV